MAEDIDELDGSELLDQWFDKKKVYHLEGTRGVETLEELVEVLGYRDGQFFGQSVSILNFLADNPGAQEALITFIGEWIDRVPEWREKLEESYEEGEEDEES
jgi:hypothetical protein